MRGTEQWQHVQEMLDKLRALPGVRTAGAVQTLALRDGGNNWGVIIEGQDPNAPGQTTYFRVVTADYLPTLGVRLRAGRLFGPADRTYADSARARLSAGDSTPPERVVVVNEALAKKFFPGQDPIGRRLGGGFRGWARIVGVVGNVAEGKLTDEPEPARYYLADQAPLGFGGYSLVFQVADGVDPASVLDAARRAVQQTAPNFAVQEVTTMRRVLDTAIGPARQVMALLGILTALALALGAVGIYGVIAHFAARRQRDWAIRVALGLPGARVVSHVVGHGAVLMAGGIAIGVLTAAGLARLIASLLYGVSALDPLAFAAAGVALLVVGLLAAFVPARRAGMTDPAIALREQ
jgi:putative ABC transport system permease protein